MYLKCAQIFLNHNLYKLGMLLVVSQITFSNTTFEVNWFFHYQLHVQKLIQALLKDRYHFSCKQSACLELIWRVKLRKPLPPLPVAQYKQGTSDFQKFLPCRMVIVWNQSQAQILLRVIHQKWWYPSSNFVRLDSLQW